MGSYLSKLVDDGGGAPSEQIKRVTTAHVLRGLDEALLAKLVLHRGYHDKRDLVKKRPLENTLEAFTKGWTMGVRYCECDITVTRNGKVILAHDETLERVRSNSESKSSSAPLGDLTYAEICEVTLKGGSKVPLLETVLEEAINHRGLLVVEFKADGNWNLLVQRASELFSEKPHLFNGVGVFMSFNHLVMKRLKDSLKPLGVKLPPFLGLTDTEIYPGYEDVVWKVNERDSLESATTFIEDFNLDGLYIRYENSFEEKRQQDILSQLMENYILGVWNAPDTIENLQRCAKFGFRFVNTDLTTHFTRIARNTSALDLSYLQPT